MDQAQNDEVDLFSVFETIWDGKWKIIFFIFISTIVGISYLLYKPNFFKVTTIIKKSNQELYYKYKYINDILKMDDVNESKYFETISNEQAENVTQFKVGQTYFSEKFRVNSELIFEMFINEFNDYEEMVTVLSENDYVKDKIRDLNDEGKRKALISFAKSFHIVKPTDKFGLSQISFIWHEVNEGISLMNDALKLTLINVQKTLLMEINNIANSIDLENKRKKAYLNIELNSIRKMNKLINAKRTRYLIEQSDIAKELGIEKNQLDTLTIESPNYPYYLRGFKAIDKELELIYKRSNEENDLMSEGYLDIKRELLLIDKDIRSKQLRDANKAINKDNISNWVNFNLELAEINNNKKPYLYLLISIFVGGVFGIFYVLISKGFKERKNI